MRAVFNHKTPFLMVELNHMEGSTILFAWIAAFNSNILAVAGSLPLATKADLMIFLNDGALERAWSHSVNSPSKNAIPVALVSLGYGS